MSCHNLPAARRARQIVNHAYGIAPNHEEWRRALSLAREEIDAINERQGLALLRRGYPTGMEVIDSLREFAESLGYARTQDAIDSSPEFAQYAIDISSGEIPNLTRQQVYALRHIVWVCKDRIPQGSRPAPKSDQYAPAKVRTREDPTDGSISLQITRDAFAAAGSVDLNDHRIYSSPGARTLALVRLTRAEMWIKQVEKKAGRELPEDDPIRRELIFEQLRNKLISESGVKAYPTLITPDGIVAPITIDVRSNTAREFPSHEEAANSHLLPEDQLPPARPVETYIDSGYRKGFQYRATKIAFRETGMPYITTFSGRAMDPSAPLYEVEPLTRG